MASGLVDLSGSGPQQAYVWLSYVSYNQAENYSSWYWEAVYKNNGGAQWMSDAVHYWTLGGFAASGPNYFGIHQGWVGSGDHLLGAGYFNKWHNAAGYLDVGSLSFSIHSPHANIGSGTAWVGTGTPPRIPKTPAAPHAAVFTSADPDRIDYTISFAGKDNGGSGVLDYDLHLYELIGGTYVPIKNKKSQSSAQFFDGLEPATTYYQQYRARNAIGHGGWSPLVPMTTEAGIWVSGGSSWVGQGPRVSNGSAWVPVRPVISDGTAWKDPINV